MKSPEFLIKSFTEKAHAENFCEGNVILKCKNYFSHAGRVGMYGAEFERPRETLTNDAFLFCAHDASYDFDKGERTFVKIETPCALFEKIHTVIKPICLKFSPIFGRVQYYEEDAIPDQRINYFCPGSHDKSFFDLAFSKPSGWEKEQEVRMCFFFDEATLSNGLGSTDLKLKFRSWDFFSKCTIEYACFGQWKDARKNTVDYGIEFWVEIEFKVDFKGSQIIT